MKLASGDFEQLAIEQMDTLYRIARRLTRDPNQAEDLVQETYVRALRAKDSFKLEAFGIRPWLLRIMYNLHVSRAQKEGRQPVAMEDEHLEMADLGGAGRDTLPLDPKDFEAMDERLVRAMQSLAPEYQAVLLMWAVEEMPYKEIAQVLEVPIGTIMSRLHRARQRLMEQLRDFATETGILRE